MVIYLLDLLVSTGLPSACSALLHISLSLPSRFLLNLYFSSPQRFISVFVSILPDSFFTAKLWLLGCNAVLLAIERKCVPECTEVLPSKQKGKFSH